MKRSAALVEQERGQADVDQLGRLLADDVDAEQLHVVDAEEQLEEPVVVADDVPARVAGIGGLADDVGRRPSCGRLSSVSPAIEHSGMV